MVKNAIETGSPRVACEHAAGPDLIHLAHLDESEINQYLVLRSIKVSVEGYTSLYAAEPNIEEGHKHELYTDICRLLTMLTFERVLHEAVIAQVLQVNSSEDNGLCLTGLVRRMQTFNDVYQG